MSLFICVICLLFKMTAEPSICAFALCALLISLSTENAASSQAWIDRLKPEVNVKSFNIKAQLLLSTPCNVLSSTKFFFYFEPLTRTCILSVYLLTWHQSVIPTRGVYFQTRSSRALKPEANNIRCPVTQNQLTPDLSSWLAQKHNFLFFLMKNGLRNIRSGSKSWVWRQDYRGDCWCCVSQRGSDSDDQGVMESYPGRYSQSWDYYVCQVGCLSLFCAFPG